MFDVSVVVRYHSTANAELLEQALFSLCVQTTRVQPIIILHNCTDEFIDIIETYLNLLPWSFGLKNHWKIKNINSEDDIRSKMLNEGIALSDSKLVGFLDYDDIVYQNAYEVLIKQYEKTNAQFIVGGCRKAHLDMFSGDEIYITKKESFLTKKVKRLDLLVDNYFPIHSYLIDTESIEKEDLYFNESLHVLEDYAFILNTFAKYTIDLTAMDTPVCEYRMRNDETHTTPFHDLDSINDMPSWSKGRAFVEHLKSTLKFNHTLSELKEMIDE